MTAAIEPAQVVEQERTRTALQARHLRFHLRSGGKGLKRGEAESAVKSYPNVYSHNCEYTRAESS